jgi:hypothetical protein
MLDMPPHRHGGHCYCVWFPPFQPWREYVVVRSEEQTAKMGLGKLCVAMSPFFAAVSVMYHYGAFETQQFPT